MLRHVLYNKRLGRVELFHVVTIDKISKCTMNPYDDYALSNPREQIAI